MLFLLLLLLGEQDGCWVCECGAETKERQFNNDYKDTEGSGAHAEKLAPRATGVVAAFADGVAAARAARSATEGGSIVLEGARRKQKLGHASEIAERTSKIDQLEQRDYRKLCNVQFEIDQLLTDLSPVEDLVAREIRTSTARIFCDSVNHGKLCKSPACCMKLHLKPHRTVARKCFVFLVERLCTKDDLPGSTKASVAHLHKRVLMKQELRDNATQHEACIGIIRSLDTNDPCKPCSLLPAAAVATAEPKSVIQRQMSDLDPSHSMQVRNEVRRLGGEFYFPVGVRATAIAALGSPAVARVLASSKLSECSKALVLLRSAAIPGSEGDCRQQAANVGACASEVDRLVEQLRSMPSASAAVAQDEDDQLY